MRRGPEPGKIIPLEAQQINLGRGTKNDIIIQDNEVSRDHLRLVRTTNGYELHDLESSNGTFVNGQIVDGIWLLQSECIIELGDSITFEYRLGEPDGDVEPGEQIHVNQALPATRKSYLVVQIEGQDEPGVYVLEGMTVKVGRSTSNDIVIVEPEMSREHFRLTLMPQGYYIEDTGSTNGTFVNGDDVIQSRLLYTNDVIQVGTTIQMQLTNTPDAFMMVTKTDLLTERLDATESLRKHRILPHDATGLMNVPEPTDVGTGLDNRSLEDEILVTYARSDWDNIVAPMMNKFYEEDVKAWVDQYLTESSNDWLLATEQARLECWLLLVVVSPAALRSEAVRRNWRHFHNREKPIILLIAAPIERLPIGAKKLPHIQFNPAVPEVAFKQLTDEIHRLRPES